MRTILEEVFHMPVGERDIAGIIFSFLESSTLLSGLAEYWKPVFL